MSGEHEGKEVRGRGARGGGCWVWQHAIPPLLAPLALWPGRWSVTTESKQRLPAGSLHCSPPPLPPSPPPPQALIACGRREPTRSSNCMNGTHLSMTRNGPWMWTSISHDRYGPTSFTYSMTGPQMSHMDQGLEALSKGLHRQTTQCPECVDLVGLLLYPAVYVLTYPLTTVPLACSLMCVFVG